MSNLREIYNLIKNTHFSPGEARAIMQSVTSRTLSEDRTTAYAIMAPKPGEHETITARRAQIENDLKTLELAHKGLTK